MPGSRFRGDRVDRLDPVGDALDAQGSMPSAAQHRARHVSESPWKASVKALFRLLDTPSGPHIGPCDLVGFGFAFNRVLRRDASALVIGRCSGVVCGLLSRAEECSEYAQKADRDPEKLHQRRGEIEIME